MKAMVSFNVDVSLLKDFNDALKRNNAYPDEVIEEFMRDYVSNLGSVVPPVVNSDYMKLTEELLTNCESYRVGELVKIVLRKLLEAGVASEQEIEEMQKASGRVQTENYHTAFGRYNNENFKTAFPLLITEEGSDKFYKFSLKIYGETYYLCSQWADRNLEPLRNWIRSHLPKWFERATEEQKSNMIRFIKSR